MNQSASIVANTVSNFGFSCKPAKDLTAPEYTLVDIELDLSPSTGPFIKDLEKALKTVHEALQKSPRAEQLLVRVQTFDGDLHEVHGFVNLKDIDPSSYSLQCVGGSTALFDASLNGVEALESEGARLDGLDYGVNAVSVIITDGENNYSRVCRNPAKIGEAALRARRAEKLESLKVIVIGVGNTDASNPDQPDSATKAYLEGFVTEAGLDVDLNPDESKRDPNKQDQFVWIGAATASKIAKMAKFISNSVSSSSQSLGTGGASKNLTF